MSWARICMENSWTRVAAIVLIIGWIMPESLRAGGILEKGEIDSSTVEVGAFAADIHGQGERQHLVTARGNVPAMGAERLILARAGISRQERIQTLVVKNLEPASRRSAQRPPGLMENEGFRIVAKLAAGTASGIAVATISTIALVIIFLDEGNDNPWAGLAILYDGLLIGSGVGFPLGVTWIDPHDSSSKTMCAGIASAGVAVSLAVMTPQDHSLVYPALLSPLVLPAISSIVVSELSRKPPEDRRVSVGLSPTPHGGLFARAQLRF